MSQPGERSDARANRERVIRSARDLFGERGFDVEMREIAERAGVGVGTLYRNFATKEELVRALVNELAHDGGALIEQALACPDPGEGLRTFIDGCWRLADSHGQIARALRADGEAMGADPAASERLKDGVSRLFERALAAGAVNPLLDFQFLAFYLSAMLEVYVALRAAQRPHGEAARQCTEAFLHAIAAPPRR